MPATRPYLPYVLLVFDFDSTLGTDSIDATLDVHVMERAEYERDFVEPLGRGWEAIIRRGQALIELGRKQGQDTHAMDASWACRKPEPGLLIEAMAHHGIGSAATLFVGDTEVDRLAALTAGVRFLEVADLLRGGSARSP